MSTPRVADSSRAGGRGAAESEASAGGMPYTKIELEIMALQGPTDADVAGSLQGQHQRAGEVGRAVPAGAYAPGNKLVTSQAVQARPASGKENSPTGTSNGTSSASSRVPSPTASLDRPNSPDTSQTAIGSSPDSVGSLSVFDDALFDGKNGQGGRKRGGKRHVHSKAAFDLHVSWIARLWRSNRRRTSSSPTRRQGGAIGGVGSKRLFPRVRNRASAI